MGLPKVRCILEGEDGNAFAILGRFRRAALAAGWDKSDIGRLVDEATKGDYQHLLRVISEHCENYGLKGNENDEEGDEYGP